MADARVREATTTSRGDHHPDASADVVHAGHRWTFARHLGEMVVAMWVGMALGALVWGQILGAAGTTPSEARTRYPELYLVIMAFNMTVPMVAWMRFRGHGWRSCLEMSAAMVAPGIVVLGAFWLGMTDGPACGLYCGLMIAAMAIVMRVRRVEYGG